jgi:hypothetical protein
MDALTAQSIRGLRSRLEAFRPRGLVPALMAEFRLDAPDEERQPLAGFEPKWQSVSRCRLPDGADVGRAVWLGGDSEEFRNFCTDAARAALPTIRAAGYAVGLGAPNPRESWLWAMFELAALRLRGSYLRLVENDVLRACAPEITITETVLESIDSSDQLFAFAAAAGQTRYWRLASAVEASIAVLDLAESVAPSQPPAAPVAPQAKGRLDRPRNTRAIDVDHYLGRLEASLRKRIEAELGQSETAVMEAMIRELYSLSAEDLVQPLRKFGYRGSAKTISRPGKSSRYEAWKRYRRGGATPSTVADPTQPAGRKAPRTHTAARVKDAVDSGGLSLRAGGRGTTRVRKTAAERAADRDADQFAREAGIDLPAAE